MQTDNNAVELSHSISYFCKTIIEEIFQLNILLHISPPLKDFLSLSFIYFFIDLLIFVFLYDDLFAKCVHKSTLTFFPFMLIGVFNLPAWCEKHEYNNKAFVVNDARSNNGNNNWWRVFQKVIHLLQTKLLCIWEKLICYTLTDFSCYKWVGNCQIFSTIISSEKYYYIEGFQII